MGIKVRDGKRKEKKRERVRGKKLWRGN